MNEPKVITPSDYKSRTEIWSQMRVGDRVHFAATTLVQYASVRGSAYGYGRSRNKIFKATRIDEDIVAVWRER